MRMKFADNESSWVECSVLSPIMHICAFPSQNIEFQLWGLRYASLQVWVQVYRFNYRRPPSRYNVIYITFSSIYELCFETYTGLRLSFRTFNRWYSVVVVLNEQCRHVLRHNVCTAIQCWLRCSRKSTLKTVYVIVTIRIIRNVSAFIRRSFYMRALRKTVWYSTSVSCSCIVEA
jgi:hypothetical protein